MVDLLSILALVSGAFFFSAGTIGLLRLPDVYTRLHALTKADNFGLGLLFAGLTVDARSWMVGFELLLIWMLVMAASTTACHLVARNALAQGIGPSRRP